MLAAATGGRASTGSRSRARSRCPCSRAAATSAVEVRRACRAPGATRRGRPRRRRSPTGCRGRPAPAIERVVAALAVGARRSGGSAAGRATSKPSSASRGSCARDAREAAPRAREELVPRAEARAARGRRRRCSSAATRRRSPCRVSPASAARERLLDGSSVVAPLEQAGALRTSSPRSRSRPGLAVDLAAQLLCARSRRGRSRPRSRNASGPAGRRRRSRPAVVTELRVERAWRSRQRVVAGPAVAHDRAQHVVPVAEDLALHLDAVADARLHGIAAAVDQRLGVLDLDPGSAAAGGGTWLCSLRQGRTSREVSRHRRPRQELGVASHADRAPRGSPAAIRTSLPGGRLGAEAYALRRLARRRRPVLVADAAARPARQYGSPYRSPSAFAASPALLAEPGAPVSSAEDDGLPRAPASGSATGTASPAARRARRPGPLRARMERAARLRAASAACG